MGWPCNPVTQPRAPTSIIIGQHGHIPARIAPPAPLVQGETVNVTESIMYILHGAGTQSHWIYTTCAGDPQFKSVSHWRWMREIAAEAAALHR